MRPSVPEGVAAAVALIIVVIASVGVATRGTTTTASTASSPTSTPQGSSSLPVPSATPGSAPAATGAAPTNLPAAPPATAAPLRATAGPPKPGTYEYFETDENGTTTSTLDIKSQGGGRETENTDSGSTIDEVVWRANGKFETATTFSFPSGAVRCVWSPQFVEYQFPLRTGSSWTVRTACHPNAQSSISLSGTSRVTGRQRHVVEGTPVDTWVIVTDATIRFAGNGTSFSQAIRDEDHFAPAYGVTVHEIATTTDTDPGGQTSNHRVARELKSLKATQSV